MPLQLSDIESAFQQLLTIEYYSELSSTNDRALELAREQADSALVITDFQTAGRGRRGAVWTAPAGCSALFSLLIHPVTPLANHHLAILTGVGIATGLQSLGIDAKIKWPNDIMVADRKVAGILIETTADNVIIGVGINCNVPSEAFPMEIQTRAASLHTLHDQPISRTKVIITVVGTLLQALQRVEAGGVIKVLYDWNKLNWYARKKVRVTGAMGMVEGDGLFLDGHRLLFHVFKDCGVIPMPLSSSVEVR